MTDIPATSLSLNLGLNNPTIPRDTLQILSENMDIALSALSDKNRREYESTFSKWQQYSISRNVSPFSFDLVTVKNFLTDNQWSFNTRKVRLAHLRKFAELLAHSDKQNNFDFAYNYGRLALLKPKSLGGAKQVIKTRSLSNRHVYKLFEAIGSDSNSDTRNRAILGLMLMGGLRASEVVSLKWQNVSIQAGTIFVFEGKGKRSRYIPMLGDLPTLLTQWQTRQSKYGKYSLVCNQIFRSDKLASDNLCTTRLVSSLTKKLSRLTGINFNPHDTRRTAITALLSNGASVPEARDFARHSSGETTLRYAQSHSASALGGKLKDKLKYGDVLGAQNHSKDGRYYECSNSHKFNAFNPTECPICGNSDLTHQASMFDD